MQPDPEKHDGVLVQLLDREDPISVRTEWRDSLVSAISEALPQAAYRQDDSMRIQSLMEDFIVRAGGASVGVLPERKASRVRPENPFSFSRSRSANEVTREGRGTVLFLSALFLFAASCTRAPFSETGRCGQECQRGRNKKKEDPRVLTLQRFPE